VDARELGSREIQVNPPTLFPWWMYVYEEQDIQATEPCGREFVSVCVRGVAQPW
jgi:hypothetical protein